MRASANKHRRDVEFSVGDSVLLKLQQYRQYSVARPLSTKLARRFYGPFEVLERIGQVAYRLQLPPGSRVHNVFHVSLLRPFVAASGLDMKELPPVFARGRPVSRPFRLVDRRSVWHDGAAVEEGLLAWEDDGGENPTWEPIAVIRRRFPGLLLEDKEASMEGGVDTCTTRQHVAATPVELEVTEESREMEQDFATRGREEMPAPVTAKKDRPRRKTRPPERLGDFVSH